MKELEKGSLLLASPEINEGLFCRSALLLCEHSHAGSFGLVINKPLHAELPAEILDPSSIVNPHLALRAGGPIQPGQMMLLHSDASIPDQTLEVIPGVYIGGDIEFLHRAAASSNGPHTLLCFGYTGWGPGLLEQEYLAGAWFSAPASAPALFETAPESLWRASLQAMGGKYAALSMIPENLDLN